MTRRRAALWSSARQVTAAVNAMQAGRCGAARERPLRSARAEERRRQFAGEIAALGDAYVNDAFGTCHNDKDASDGGGAGGAEGRLASRGRSGMLVERRNSSDHQRADGQPRPPPVLAVMGGAKVSDKIAFINEAARSKVDKLLIGGKMAYTFLKSRGVDVGRDPRARTRRSPPPSRCCSTSGTKITLPTDYARGKVGRPAPDASVARRTIPAGYEGVDIGPKTMAAVRRKRSGTPKHGHLERAGRVVRAGGVRRGARRARRRGDGGQRGRTP